MQNFPNEIISVIATFLRLKEIFNLILFSKAVCKELKKSQYLWYRILKRNRFIPLRINFGSKIYKDIKKFKLKTYGKKKNIYLSLCKLLVRKYIEQKNSYSDDYFKDDYNKRSLCKDKSLYKNPKDHVVEDFIIKCSKCFSECSRIYHCHTCKKYDEKYCKCVRDILWERFSKKRKVIKPNDFMEFDKKYNSGHVSYPKPPSMDNFSFLARNIPFGMQLPVKWVNEKNIKSSNKTIHTVNGVIIGKEDGKKKEEKEEKTTVKIIDEGIISFINHHGINYHSNDILSVFYKIEKDKDDDLPTEVESFDSDDEELPPLEPAVGKLSKKTN